MMSAIDLTEVLKPVAPPKVIENVYGQDELDRIVDVIQTHGPWPGIVAQHFQSVDEMIATTTGNIAPRSWTDARRRGISALPGILREELGVLLSRTRGHLLQQPVP